jgi:hypothetical protein
MLMAALCRSHWDNITFAHQQILSIRGNSVELALLYDVIIYNPLNISKLTFDFTDNSRIWWQLPPLLQITSCMGTSTVIESITMHWPFSDRTSLEFEENWEVWENPNNRWKPEELMSKANEIVKLFWKVIGTQPNAKRNALWKNL